MLVGCKDLWEVVMEDNVHCISFIKLVMRCEKGEKTFCRTWYTFSDTYLLTQRKKNSENDISSSLKQFNILSD